MQNETIVINGQEVQANVPDSLLENVEESTEKTLGQQYQDAVRAYNKDETPENKQKLADLRKSLYDDIYQQLEAKYTLLRENKVVYRENLQQAKKKDSGVKISVLRTNVRQLHQQSKELAKEILALKRDCNNFRF